MMPRWQLSITGRATPKGSWVICPHGRPVMHSGQAYYRIRDLHLKPNDGKKDGKRVDHHAQWRHAIELAVLEAGRPRAPIAGAAVSVQAVFYLHRPQKPEHSHPIGRVGDLDKLLRAVGDALTGVYYADDSQIVDWSACKLYADSDHPEGAVVVVQIADSDELLTFDHC